jgi:hypothetical protein
MTLFGEIATARVTAWLMYFLNVGRCELCACALSDSEQRDYP